VDFKIKILPMINLIFLVLLLFVASVNAQKIEKIVRYYDRVELVSSKGKFIIIPLRDNTVRVKFLLREEEKLLPEFVFVKQYKVPNFKVEKTNTKIFIKCKEINVIINRETGKIDFADPKGNIFLQEKENSRIVKPNLIDDEELCYFIEQSFLTFDDEYLFGLGQFQDGHYNIKFITRRLTQVNSQISIPFIYSSRGYGLIWHQYGLTDFNPADSFIKLDKLENISNNIDIADVTTTKGTQKILQNQNLYTGKFDILQEGEYVFFLDLGNMGNRYFIAIDGNVIIDQSNFWLPPCVSTSPIKLKAGEHKVSIICKSDNKPKLSWRKTDNFITFRSPNANMLDYIVFYGPEADRVIASYHILSGNVPMLPIWAYGFWQCKERYTSAKQLIETVLEFRNRDIPIDVIVQDWQYWGENGWGVPKFDRINYPNPESFIKKLHDLNVHFCISIWSNPDKNSKLGNEFLQKNYYIPESQWLDYFNPEVCKEYWKVLKENMFDYGVDAWWMDAVEPENDALVGKKTFLGRGEFYRLTYPLMVSKAVYDGQRETTDRKRVCILTRSSYLGQHRYGTINWSGDINSDWDTYKRQILAGLNNSITGNPYWTTDIGGFFRPGQMQYNDIKYHEILIRWFQWGAFNPIFRIHGYQSDTEPWKYGSLVEENFRKTLNLRYRLMPYTYSSAWQITCSGIMLMRPLVMDFYFDEEALKYPYEYMFGKSILVCPVTEAMYTKGDFDNIKMKDVYLPAGTDWYDFWTGERIKGGQKVNKETPIDIIPLYVRSGTILPIGPEVQYAMEKRWDTLEIRIYEGADGEFILYEDEGDNYNYEKGMYSTITFKWDDKSKTLTIGNRKGNFPGMLKKRVFNLVLFSWEGIVFTKNKYLSINYYGSLKKIKLQNIKQTKTIEYEK